MIPNKNQNIIFKKPLANLGYNFIDNSFLPKGKDEYYLRNIQHKTSNTYRKLTAYEIEVLVRNSNTSDNWNNILVADLFNPELVKNCKFNGLIRIGKLETVSLTFSDLTVAVGLYNSTIVSCDFGDNVVIDNVNYLSHYIICDEAILVNINEMVTSETAKFGNGLLKDGEDETKRIWLELCNENAGRKVLPFNGMQPGDAYLWSKFVDDDMLQEKFKILTEKKYTTTRGYYGKVGTRTVIKNCASIKDCWIGEDAYIKGANKLKNLTVNSGNGEGKTQIGEGCEIVNGIIGYGCRIFYGVKAVRFILSNHSQLKYGARLINSFLGYNSTISCCEVLNALIFSSHEQHHNNSFLCAALLNGQSNLAAGATIGSNHNSRGADGEIIAGRGFWPGLCVSLKHNSKFSSFTILAKGDYTSELNISIPFSLVSNDLANDKLIIMPAYWFMYNMYALARNEWKYYDRDKRISKIQTIEYASLAPDTITEMFDSIQYFEQVIVDIYFKKNQTKITTKQAKQLLGDNDAICNDVEIDGNIFENSKRKVVIVKIAKAYQIFNTLINYYIANILIEFAAENKLTKPKQVIDSLPKAIQYQWINVGGQLMITKDVDQLKSKIKTNKIKSWDDVHGFYKSTASNYNTQKLQHALDVFCKLHSIKSLDESLLKSILKQAIETKKWITESIETSREKDYTNEFRKMVYENDAEMNKVLGSFANNSFINQQKIETEKYIKKINSFIK